MPSTRLEFVPLDAVQMIEDGAVGLASYLAAVAGAPPAVAAFLVVVGRFGEEGATYYLFTPEEFARLAAPSPPPTSQTRAGATILDELDPVPVLRPRQLPSGPAVVVESGRSGVWIEVPEQAASAAPPRDGELSWGIPAGGGDMAPPPTPGQAPGTEAESVPPPSGGQPQEEQPQQPLPAPSAPPPGERQQQQSQEPPPLPSVPPVRSAPPPSSPPTRGRRSLRERLEGALRRDGGGARANGDERRGTPSPPPAAAGPPPVDEEVVRRNPHLDLSDDSPPPGSEFTVTVYADAAARRHDEESSAIEVAAPADVRQFPMRVWLTTTADLQVEEPNDLTLVIDRDTARSTEAVFRVRVAAGATPGATASVSALFVYEGRPSGHVMRRLTIGATAATAPVPTPVAVSTAAEPAATPAIRIDARAAAPDLTIQVAAAPDNNGQRFLCRVTTPLLPGGEEQSPAPWNLPAASSTIVPQFMAEFTKSGIDNRQRRAALVGAGKLLFSAAPDNFKKTFWELVDAGKLPETIYIVSQEPYVPWELMIPNRRRADGTIEQRPPLGVEFAVGRWVSDVPLSPIQQVKLADAWVVAPQYRGRDALANSAAEAQLLAQLFSARTVTPALWANLDAVFGSPGVTLLHFVCHGVAGGGGVQTIKLDPDETLTSLSLLGMTGAQAFSQSQPMVFLNACEIGRPEPALVGVEGFAKSFISLGARCVIAPLWSVKDSIAHEIATEFYQRISQEPGVPLAKVLRDIRRKAYDEAGGEDTYAAYSFYGDPLAAVARN